MRIAPSYAGKCANDPSFTHVLSHIHRNPGVPAMKATQPTSPAPRSGAGFVIVAVGAVVAALGIIQVESQGVTEQARGLSGIHVPAGRAPLQDAAARQRMLANGQGGLDPTSANLRRVGNTEAGK
jgi:hypothetical protein